MDPHTESTDFCEWRSMTPISSDKWQTQLYLSKEQCYDKPVIRPAGFPNVARRRRSGTARMRKMTRAFCLWKFWHMNFEEVLILLPPNVSRPKGPHSHGISPPPVATFPTYLRLLLYSSWDTWLWVEQKQGIKSVIPPSLIRHTHLKEHRNHNFSIF